MYDAGGKLELKEALEKLCEEGLRMPGAMCGSVTSIGAALALIDGTGPLSTDGTWEKHMEFTSSAVARMSEIGGPRCCKRDAFVSLTEAVRFINEKYGMKMPVSEMKCTYSPNNQQCIGTRCPYHM